MNTEEKIPVVKSKEASPPVPAKQESTALSVATYSLVGLEDQGDELYISELSRSYTRKELENPGLLELLHLQGWPHVKKTK